MTTTIALSHQTQLSLDQIVDVAYGQRRVSLSAQTAQLLEKRRAEVVAHVTAQAEPAYGFNRGFGHNVHQAVAMQDELLQQLQLNLLRSHAMGVGPTCPPHIIRATMLLRANSLCRGYSGVRAIIIQRLIDFINEDVVPVVPQYGSVSASGDLIPLSHIALALIGEGEVFFRGTRCPAATALSTLGWPALQLQMKEGLALNNGVQFITAIGICTAATLSDLLQSAAVVSALSVQVLMGSATPFRQDLHALRPHPGAQRIASWLRNLLNDSPITQSHEDKQLDGEVQDPYSLRCTAQVLGTCVDLVAEAQRTFEIEANSVTDNPLILPDSAGHFTDVVSGGHFHGMPVAVKLYNLIQASALIASLSNTRCARFVDEQRNKGLGADLIWPQLPAEVRATSSGLMAAEYTSASITNWIWGQSMPSHLFSIPTDAGQEDHVSMGAPVALRLLDILPRLAEVIATEFTFAAQAAAIRRIQPYFPSRAPLPDEVASQCAQWADRIQDLVAAAEQRDVAVEVSVKKRYPWAPQQRLLSPICEQVLTAVHTAIPTLTLTADRSLSAELSQLAQLILARGLIDAAGRDLFTQ